MPLPKLTINIESSDLQYDANGGLTLKLSPDSGNGLQIQNGKLVGVKGPQGDPGTGSNQNNVGNAMGNGTGAMPVVGMNNTVSRHKKCHDSSKSKYSFIHSNEGPVMSNYDGYMSDHGSVAYFMYNQIRSF